MLSRNDGVANSPAITTLAESPVRAGILWVGTDDGNVQVSRDGETWKNVTANIPGVPKGTYVSRVLPSAFDQATAYVAFDGHRSDDYNIYLFKTTDFGETWKPISNGIPKNEGTLHVVREHPRNRDLLFAGGEFGLYISFDRGENWQELKNNLPRVPIDDIQIHNRDNDLILGTHGRSAWILDSIYGLEQMNKQTADTPVMVFHVRPGVMWKMANIRDFDGHDQYFGQNPPYGVIIDFWSKSKPDMKDVKITISRQDKVIATLKPKSVEAGLNRIVWDMRADRAVPLTPQEEANIERQIASGGPGQPRGGPLVDPGGEYVVEVQIGSNKDNKKFNIQDDPRITWFTPADRQKRRAAIDQLVEMTKQVDALRKKYTAADQSVTQLQAAWKRPEAQKPSADIQKMAEDLKKTLDDMRPLFVNRGFGGEQNVSREERLAELAKPEPDFVLPALNQRVQQMINQLEGYSAAPAKSQLDQIELTKTAIADAGKKMDALRAQVTKFNDAMNAAKVPFVPVP